MNTLHICIILSDGAEELIEDTLCSWDSIVDSCTILLNNFSTKTEFIVMNLKNKLNMKIYIHYSDFTNFSETRNKCIALAPNNYKYIIMIDDSYVLTGPLSLIEQLKKVNDDVISIDIMCNNYIYKRSLIFKKGSAHFVGDVHEYLNKNDTYIIKNSYINDVKNTKAIERSKKRYSNYVFVNKYYAFVNLLSTNNVQYPIINTAFNEVIDQADKYGDHECKYMVHVLMFYYTNHLGTLPLNERLKLLFKAIDYFPSRSHEAYYLIYKFLKVNGRKNYLLFLRKAYERIPGDLVNYRYPFDNGTNDKIINAMIKERIKY